MIIGPKYKIARRLGAGVFEKTQTQKFALSEAKKKEVKGKRPRPKSDYGIQMLEKQKARYSYALTEKQFSKYVKQAISKKGSDQKELLYQTLETRLDNAILCAGVAPTRLAARQLVSHGHIVVNGQRVTVPSIHVKIGDKLSIREGSLKKPVFATITERLTAKQSPSWLKVDPEKKEITVQGLPKLAQDELLFNIGQVLEFYSR